MKKLSWIKYFVLGVMVTIFGLSCVESSIASNGSFNIPVTYSNIKIYVDGDLISPKDANGNIVEPFNYNGTVYLPVRAVGSAVGKLVTWDGNAQSVYLGTVPVNTDSNNDTSTTTTNPSPSPSITPQSITVYITKTGSKYHTGTCRYLSQSKIAITLAAAKSQGYGPCSVCHPPV